MQISLELRLNSGRNFVNAVYLWDVGELSTLDSPFETNVCLRGGRTNFFEIPERPVCVWRYPGTKATRDFESLFAVRYNGLRNVSRAWSDNRNALTISSNHFSSVWRRNWCQRIGKIRFWYCRLCFSGERKKEMW